MIYTFHEIKITYERKPTFLYCFYESNTDTEFIIRATKFSAAVDLADVVGGDLVSYLGSDIIADVTYVCEFTEDEAEESDLSIY